MNRLLGSQDPFVARMERFHRESEVFNATPGDAAYEDMPDFSLCNDLKSGAVKVESAAGVALAVRYVVDDDCIGDTTAEQVLKAALAFLEAKRPAAADLASDPGTAAMIARQRDRGGQMVPVLLEGSCVGFIHDSLVGVIDVPDPLPVADYIIGMELLGFRFHVFENAGRCGWGMAMPEEPFPHSWDVYALRLEAAMDRAARRDEIVAFLTARTTGAGGEM